MHANAIKRDGTILIVDDQPDNLRLLSNMLTDYGYEVRTVTDGPMALDSVALEAPDLILLDISMPDMNGYEVCEQLKAQEQSSDIPVIFISAMNETVDRVRAFAVGGADYITKPFHIEEVQARIENQLIIQRTKGELRKFKRAVDQSPSSIVITDTSGAIEYVNPKFTEVTGYTFEEAYGKNPRILKSSHIPSSDYRALWDAITSGHEWRGDLYNRKKNGEYYWESVSISPIFNDQHVITHFLAVKEDITGRKQIEESLDAARQSAEAATHAKSEFLASMSHEIRTPMNAIIGMSNLLLDTPLSHEQQDYVQTIRLSGDTLLTLINDILDFSKIEAGRLELETYSFHLYDCIEEAIDLLAPKAAEKGLELAYMIEDQMPVDLVGDITRIRQILVNLLSNAIKFTSEGDVVVSVVPQPCQEAYERAEDEQTTPFLLHIAVRDTGIGIPADRLDTLFQNFRQADVSTSRQYGGTGLGLAISKQLAELMGGTIWAESEVDKGSTFHVTLEIGWAPADERPFLSRTHTALENKRALIVEHHPTNRAILSQWATRWGMRSSVTGSGQEAWQWMAAGEPFDVLILSYGLSDMDSVALVRQIRSLSDADTLPIVLWTSITARRDVSQSIEDEHTTLLVKPVRPAMLHHVLCRLFAGTPQEIPLPTVWGEIDRQMGQRYPLRILMAEDNVINQKVTLRLLEKLGYRADVASNGIEVLRAIQRQSYDVLFMDVQMPQMDGIEATQAIRKKDLPGENPWIIAMTAHALQGTREWLLQTGMNDYVSKPVKVEDLVNVLSHALQNLGMLSEHESQEESPPPWHNGSQSAPLEREGESPADDISAIVASTQADPLDADVFHDFLELVGGRDTPEASEMLRLFLDDALEHLATVRQALEQRDVETWTRAAHSLKSSSAQLGAMRLSDLSKKLEMMGKSETLAGADEVLSQAEAEYDRVCEMLGLG